MKNGSIGSGSVKYFHTASKKPLFSCLLSPMKAPRLFLLLVVLMAPAPAQAIGPDNHLVRCFFSGEELSFAFSESYNMIVVVLPKRSSATSVSVSKERIKFNYRNASVRVNRKTSKALISNRDGQEMMSGNCLKPILLSDDRFH